ncbi:craniofacial development protein 2-like [Aphis craccivora]|uniref:Craniofacial development protein 2-like n=1 Tax=Aphis craccivora TaxID=307492 RepID=A0A6G0ZMQ3_APHCR|nr:craniofacial development protein 2-like [Aphis craccivora]
MKLIKFSTADVMGYYGADSDTDHFIVVSRFRLKLKKNYLVGKSQKKNPRPATKQYYVFIHYLTKSTKSLKKRYASTHSTQYLISIISIIK